MEIGDPRPSWTCAGIKPTSPFDLATTPRLGLSKFPLRGSFPSLFGRGKKITAEGVQSNALPSPESGRGEKSPPREKTPHKGEAVPGGSSPYFHLSS